MPIRSRVPHELKNEPPKFSRRTIFMSSSRSRNRSLPSLSKTQGSLVYGILFRATNETLSTIAADPQHLGAEIGFFAVLHSWGQNLDPHLHCVVPGAGISPDGTRWISCRPRFFLSVRVHSRLFRRLFLTYLQLAFDSGKLRFFSSLATLQDPQAFSRHLDPVRNVKWVVYVKPPFAGPQQVVDYAGRYTHRVAISNHRIVGIGDGQVKLKWRDYRGRRVRPETPAPCSA